MQIVVSALLYGALAEIRVARAGDVLSPDDQDLALTIFNELLDSLNADPTQAIYTNNFLTFTLTPALQPHTIGLAANVPAPTFAVAIGRPTRLLAANLIISAGTIRVPLTLRDDQWWMNVRARSVTASIPTDLFYSTDYPNGSIYLWPVPSTAYSIELETATMLAQVAAADTLDLPQGYPQALRLTLAELCGSPFGQSVSQETRFNARQARMRAWGSPDVPNLVTRDAGMPGGRGGGFNYLTGEIT